jgi:hypothetical protein
VLTTKKKAISGSSGGSSGRARYSGGSSGYSGEYATDLARVRQLLSANNLNAAETVLRAFPCRTRMVLPLRDHSMRRWRLLIPQRTTFPGPPAWIRATPNTERLRGQ